VALGRGDLAELRRADLAVGIFQHGAFDLAHRRDAALDQDLAVEAQREAARGVELIGIARLGDADRRAEIGRLDEQLARTGRTDRVFV